MDNTIAKFLLSKASIDKKIAVINALGWNFKGKGNAEAFCLYLNNPYGFDNEKIDLAFADRVNSDNLLCYGYLLAMDDYFQPERALPYIEHAVKKKPNSLTFKMLEALVKAQIALGKDWGDVWVSVSNVVDDKTLKKDMSVKAVNEIMEYINLYKDY
ncbi:MAG: hypothetical protein PHV17_06855 [Candidatus Omnitrophica bacterium]|nr:hypothetical protein [Candidatus Omnitrophota bacterium]